MSNKHNSINSTRDRLRKKRALKLPPKKICLTMIVKNESRNMVRLLNSLIGTIDMISIVDTGSTDDTEEIIIKWGTEHKIPTKVHHNPFINFSHNRTHSVRAAKETYPDADYFLLSDADFVWETNIKIPFNKQLLIDHKYMIDQYNSVIRYSNVRLLSSKVTWECVGVTHEYWQEVSDKDQEYQGEVRTSKITSLLIHDLEDGGCKDDKFIRDERLLKEGLADPNASERLKTRYKFYLGQTLKDVGKYEEAIEYYQKRIQDKGWQEEIYYSIFQIGVCYENLGWRRKRAIELTTKLLLSEQEKKELEKCNPMNKIPSELLKESNSHFASAAVSYISAYKFRKTRAESLYYACKMFRSLEMYQNAYDLALDGKKIPYTNDTLFIQGACYDYLFDFELSIVCYHLGKKREGQEACERLLGNPNVTTHLMKHVEANSRFYI